MEQKTEIKLNRSQALIKMVNANVTYVVGPRANGKTFSIGDRIEHLSEVMPRTQILLLSDTYERLETKVIPNILNYFVEAGLVENEDYVTFKRPPEFFIKPLIPLKKFDRVISFRDGMALCLISGNTEGSANAFNAQALITDEAKFVKESHVTAARKVLRGAFSLYGHLPEYRSQWFFTDKYPEKGTNIKWIMAKRKLNNDNLVKAVTTLQYRIYELDVLIGNSPNDAVFYELKKEKTVIEEKLNRVRKEMVYFCEGLPYENIDNLGEKYYRDLRRDLKKYEYEIAIENRDPDVVENAFYPALNSRQHYHFNMDDVNPDKPLSIAFDYNWYITPMVVAQKGKINGNDFETINIVAGIHTLADGGIDATCKLFAETFKNHKTKKVNFIFDHTAVGRNPGREPYYVLVHKKLTELGWYVNDCYVGAASEYNIRFETIKKAMVKQNEGSLLFNKVRCEYLLLSLQQAGAIASGGVTKKDKSQEKNRNYPAEETTDYSEAFDCLLWGELQFNYINKNSAAAGFGLGFANKI